MCTEKRTQKGKYKNPKVAEKCEIVISKNRIIKKSKSLKIQKSKNPIVRKCTKCEIVKSKIELFKNPKVQICKVEKQRKITRYLRIIYVYKKNYFYLCNLVEKIVKGYPAIFPAIFWF